MLTPENPCSRLECGADEVEIPPYQTTFTRRPKPIEREIKFDWQDIQGFQPDACPGIRRVADTARENIRPDVEEQQRAPIYPRSADRSLFFPRGL